MWFLKRYLNDISTISYLVYWVLMCWYHCFIFIHNVCCETFKIKWTFGSISTIPPMVIRSWLNNSLITWSNDWAYISTATVSQLYYIFIKDFWDFMFVLWFYFMFENGSWLTWRTSCHHSFQQFLKMAQWSILFCVDVYFFILIFVSIVLMVYMIFVETTVI